MKRRDLLVSLLIGSGAICIVLAIVCIGALLYLSVSGGFTFKSTSQIIQSVQPETVEQARQRVAVSVMRLPDSAKNVQYAFYAEWIAELELVRFEAPVKDCRAVAEEIVARHNAEHPDDKIPGLRQIDPTGRDSHQPAYSISTEPLSAPWFNPETIKSGLMAGQLGSHEPLVWIDTEHGVLYYFYSD